LSEICPSGLGVERQIQLIGCLIGDTDDDVGVRDVVDQWDVLVADALNVVLAVPVLEHRRAFQGFDSHNLGPVLLLESVAGGDRSG